MKDTKRLIYPLVAAIFLVIAVVAASAAGQPGSTSDPLVTKSYVDQQIALLSSRIGTSTGGASTGTVNSNTIDQLKIDVGDLTKFVFNQLNEIENLKSRVVNVENGFVVVELQKGKKLLLGSGSEAILRTGQATALKGENGNLIDISSGADLANGANITLQHLIISSRNDGRGMEIKSGVAYLLVRGGYTIQ